MYVNTTALLVLLGIHLNRSAYFEAALLIALMGFVGTVACRNICCAATSSSEVDPMLLDLSVALFLLIGGGFLLIGSIVCFAFPTCSCACMVRPRRPPWARRHPHWFHAPFRRPGGGLSLHELPHHPVHSSPPPRSAPTWSAGPVCISTVMMVNEIADQLNPKRATFRPSGISR